MSEQFSGEWFHKTALIPVRVAHEPGVGVLVNPIVPIAPGMWHDESDFLRDYARNEPVTLELLERMGWECETFTDTAEGGVLSRGVIDLPDDNDFRIYFRDGNPLSATVVSGGEVPIPFPATLRDLLNVLRVFGVESSVPPATAENPTA